MVSWWGRYAYFNNEKLKLVALKLLILHLVHHDHLDQYLGKTVLVLTHIHVEGAT